MSHDLLMPKLGLTMTEGTISEWKAKPGDPVRAGDVLFVIETDKVAFDVEAEHTGVLLDIAVPVGETVAVGTQIGRIGAAGNGGQASATVAAATPAARPSTAPAESKVSAQASPPAQAAAPVSSGARIIATPLARKLAARARVDLATVVGPGPRGRIKAADVENAARMAAVATPATHTPMPDVTPASATAAESRRRPSASQATMARRLSEVKHGVPHFYLAAEAEVSALEALRVTFNADAERPRLTMTTFLVAAVGRALADLPQANTVWMDGELVTYAASDVGIAVNAPQGLYVPVVRDAGRKSIDRIAAESRLLVERAREARLTRDDMAGGAITISNAGMYNVTYMTPIVSPGQSAILGVGSVREVFRPDAEGRPALRRELGLVLAADHRVFDGVSGLTLLNRIIGYLEAPIRLLRTD
jgi:pyruvate dehydrogenase E2 component (dihydrolipoamide acetyltransferase)